MSLCPSHSVTRVSVKWAHPPCRVFVGNGCGKQLIQSLASHGLRKMAVLVSRSRCILGPPKPNQPSFVKSLLSQGWWEVGEKQPGVQWAPNLPLSFSLPHPHQQLNHIHRCNATPARTHVHLGLSASALAHAIPPRHSTLPSSLSSYCFQSPAEFPSLRCLSSHPR